MSSISEIENCPPSPITDDPSALSFPTSSPYSSHSSCLLSQCQFLYASCYTILLYFLRYCTVRLKMFIFVFLFYVLCQKYYKPIIMLMLSSSVVSFVLQPARVICLQGFSGKNTGVTQGWGQRIFLQRIFLTQGWNPQLLWQADSLLAEPSGKSL